MSRVLSRSAAAWVEMGLPRLPGSRSAHSTCARCAALFQVMQARQALWAKPTPRRTVAVHRSGIWRSRRIAGHRRPRLTWRNGNRPRLPFDAKLYYPTGGSIPGPQLRNRSFQCFLSAGARAVLQVLASRLVPIGGLPIHISIRRHLQCQFLREHRRVGRCRKRRGRLDSLHQRKLPGRRPVALLQHDLLHIARPVLLHLNQTPTT